MENFEEIKHNVLRSEPYPCDQCKIATDSCKKLHFANTTICVEPVKIEEGADNSCKRVYISGPISGRDPEEVLAAFKKAIDELEKHGYRVFSPLDNGLPFESETHKHMRRDFNILTNEEDPFDYIYMMAGWMHSAGCRREFEVAVSCGISVIFEEICPTIKFK